MGDKKDSKQQNSLFSVFIAQTCVIYFVPLELFRILIIVIVNVIVTIYNLENPPIITTERNIVF
jgi:hypothetical protein